MEESKLALSREGPTWEDLDKSEDNGAERTLLWQGNVSKLSPANGKYLAY